MIERPSLKAVFDALSDAGSADGCDPDWCHEVLERAAPEDIEKIRQAFCGRETESEVAYKLGIWPY